MFVALLNYYFCTLEIGNVKEELKDYILHSRRQFMSMPFHEKDVLKDPIEQFNIWFENAVQSHIKDPFALTLATANKDGIPSARVVYMREVTDRGLVFFTNYKSHKGQDLLENPVACANFYWEDLYRQIRLVGKVERVSASESDAYFQSRPRESQIGAWASHQSNILSNRDELIARLDELSKEFEGQEVPRPEFWGGYLIVPFQIEFWQGRESRLHDRIMYERDSNGNWNFDRLSP